MAARPDVLSAMADARVVIPHVVKTLMRAKSMTGPQVASALNMSPSSFYARLNGVHQISVAELAALAVLFDVPVGLFYDPPSWVTPPQQAQSGCTQALSHLRRSLALSALQRVPQAVDTAA